MERDHRRNRRPSWKTPKGQHGGQRPFGHVESGDFAEYLGRAGIGQAEACGLKWEDIDVAGDTIHYVRQKTGRAFDTPLYPWLCPLLDRPRKAAGPNPSGRVFKIKNVKHALSGACRRLGLPHFTQRNLRAMRIRQMWEACADVKVIAKTQGIMTAGS